ncbi:MAG: hypothetical protein JSW51_06925 [Gemmatimonadota bacterium]|nr:MAG: hypothetical protein JSW51_06925 [Gemmatimonadota bacterium]
MKRTIVGAAMLIAAGVVTNTPASGQRIAVDLAWHSSTGARLSGSYRPAAPERSGYLYCAPDGRYLYCWDRQAYRPGRPMLVHVFHGPGYSYRDHYGYRHSGGRVHRVMDRRTYRRHEKAALRAWQRWYHEHRRAARPMYGAHRGSRRYATPRISLRLRFHL